MNLWSQDMLAHGRAEEWLGDVHPLVEQLGSADGLVSLHDLSSLLQFRPVTDWPSLQDFLRHYHTRILVPHELPAIRNAFVHVSRNELRELLVLDQNLAAEPALRGVARASRRVGQAQLKRLRPLRDERFVQRYLVAVEAGRAHGWHTLVYGMTLALYSVSLRQGLLGYAWQTTHGFIHAAARSLKISETDIHNLLENQLRPLPAAVDSLLGPVAVI